MSGSYGNFGEDVEMGVVHQVVVVSDYLGVSKEKMKYIENWFRVLALDGLEQQAVYNFIFE